MICAGVPSLNCLGIRGRSDSNSVAATACFLESSVPGLQQAYVLWLFGNYLESQWPEIMGYFGSFMGCFGV